MPGYEDRANILQGAGDMIFKLVCASSTPEQWGEWLRAPLEHAAGTANYDLVQKLLKAGADGSVGWKGCHGKTLLHAAAEGGSGQVINALIKAGAGADKNAKATTTGHTPLHVAILNGKEVAAGALIMAGVGVDVLDASGDSPLHLAIKCGHAGIAKGLLLCGANQDASSGSGDYAIHLAASRGQDETVLSLVQREANLDRLDGGGKTPLTVAVLKGRVSTVEVLLAGGADATFKNGIFITALHYAASDNKAASIPALVEAGADIEARDAAGWTPVYVAAFNRSCAAILALLRLGANVNNQPCMKLASFPIACSQGKLDTMLDAVDLLLRWVVGWDADEAFVVYGKTSSHFVPDVADANNDEDRPRLERLTKPLASAPQDRAWRRRGFLIMCRVNPGRLRIVMEIPDNQAEAIGEQPKERPSRRARRGQMKVEVRADGAHRGRACSGDAFARRRVAGGFDGAAAWLMVVTEENVFRRIVGFL